MSMRWKFMLDCSHLVEPLDRPHMLLGKSTYIAAAYQRDRHILEVWTNTGEGYQYHGVSLQLAREFAKAPIPSAFLSERIPKPKFERVRGRKHTPERA